MVPIDTIHYILYNPLGCGNHRKEVNMANITLRLDDGNVVEIIPDKDAKLSLDGTIAFAMSLMETAVKDFGSKPENVAHLTDLYDAIDAVFYRFMERSFPGIQPRAFDLSDAAVLYAQDMIIEKADKEGIDFNAALKAFEEEAKSYVRQKGKVS